ncbi:hypothetical protein OQA88_1344 [Cercophora sp. LCS_1]
MPHRSLELFHHYVHFRIFSRTACRKNPDSECVSIALSNPGTFRACLLMTALNYSWLSAPGSLHSTDMEETYLHHKLQAMRLVNEQLADPAQNISDGCLSLIAALALVESGMGDHTAAEAHLNGLFTLLDMRHPESWQHRFYGLLQRVILVAGSFIAAAKCLEPATPVDMNLGLHEQQQQQQHYTRSPSSFFSAAPMIATRLSPFYMGSLPCVEACKADVEGLVLVNALRRLSALPVSIDNNTISPSPVSSPASSPSSPSSQEAAEPSSYRLSPDVTATLLADTEAYIASLLFKPHPLVAQTQGGSSEAADPGQATTRTDPYSALPAELFPSSSRAWATAAYLYLHVLMAPPSCNSPSWSQEGVGRNRKREVEPALKRLLLETLRADVEHTEEAMRLGAYSRELWLWKVVIGAFAVEMPAGHDKDKGKGKERRREWWGWVLDREGQGQVGGIPEEEEEDEGEVVADGGLGKWFGERMGIWSQATGVLGWAAARAVLGRIVWPAAFEGDAVAEGLWWRAVGDGGREGRGELPVMVAVDPRLMC